MPERTHSEMNSEMKARPSRARLVAITLLTLAMLAIGTILAARFGDLSMRAGMAMGDHQMSNMGNAATVPAGTKAVEVRIALSEFKINSTLTTFSKNATYHFIVDNNGQVEHEFMIVPPMSGMHMSMEEMDRMALAGVNGIAAEQRKTFDVTFSDSAPPGKLEFACHLPGHYEAGMMLPINVQ